MMRWTAVSWFRFCTMVVLATFFTLYGFNLATWGQIARVHAQDIDALLEADDSDLIDGVMGDEEPADEAAPTEPEPEPEPAAEPAPAEDEDEDDEALDEEDEEEALDEEDDALDEEDDEEMDEEEAVEETPAVEPIKIGPRVDGPTAIVPVVFAASDSHKRRAAEIGLIARSYFRSSSDFTNVPVNVALKANEMADEDAQVAKAKRSLAEGIDAYDNNELEDATMVLEETFEYLGPVLEFPEYRALAEEAMLYLGACYVLDGEADEGKAAFTRLLMWKRDAKIADKPFPANVKAAFDEAKADLSQAPRGALSITSTPAGASVFVDGYFRGLTPISLDNLAVGDHFVRVTETAYQDYQITLTLFAGVPKSLPVKLMESTKYYQYRGEMTDIESRYQHRLMWENVQALGKVLGTSQLLFTRVSEANGVVTLEGLYYDLEEELYKTRTANIALANADLEQATLQFIHALVTKQTAWEDAYVPPAETAAAAAAAAGATPVYATWWFWTIIGVVVAGGVATGVYFGAFHDGGGDDGPNPDDQNFQYPNSVLVKF